MKEKRKWYHCRMWNVIKRVPENMVMEINTDSGHPCALTKEEHEIFEIYETLRREGKLGKPMSFSKPEEFIGYLDRNE